MNSDILNIKNYSKSNLSKEDMFESKDILVEYNNSTDTFNLMLLSTTEITPKQASAVISLLSEGQRIRAEYFRNRK